MVLAQTDLALPSVLPLALQRTHISSYRYGHCFRPSWASTLDERLELTEEGAVWAREDGSLLVYPHLPGEGEQVLPLEGDRLPLSYVERTMLGETTYAVTDPAAGMTRLFTGSPYKAGGLYWLVEVEDRNGNAYQIGRDLDGTPTAVVHEGGYRVSVTSEAGRVTGLSVHTPQGQVKVVGFGFDEEGNLREVTNSSGVPLRFTYDAEGRVTSWTDRNDSTYQYLYDGEGRVSRTVGPEGFLSSTFAYERDHASGLRVTRFTDSTGATTLFRINEALQVVSETDPLGHTTLFEFDSQDRLVAQTDALGHTTRLERDSHGNLLAVTAPDGVRTTARYNELNLPVEVVERGGLRYLYTYDDRGNLASATDPTGARTEYEFNGRGHLTAVRDALGATTRISTDSAGLPETVTAPSGATISFSRDAFGRVTGITDPAGGTVRQKWTVEGRPEWREHADGTHEEWVWDGEGNLKQYTDRMGLTSTYSATHFDRHAATQSPGGDYRFTHDTELRLTKVTNAQGLEWQYTYDAAGRLIAETDFDGRTLTYEHDPLGRLMRRTNGAGQSLFYERDALGRVTQLRHDDGAVSAFAHDEAGHVCRISNAHATIVLEHDLAGRVTSETVNGRTSPAARMPWVAEPTAAHRPVRQARYSTRGKDCLPTPWASDWQAVETTLGMRLPADYTQLASAYGPGAFCDFLHIYHPHAPTPWVNLTGPMPTTLREPLRKDHNEGTHPVPHDPQHLFAIGVTDNGEYLFWITDPHTDPDSWRITVNEARGPRWYTYDGNLTSFLTDVLTGRTTIPQFPKSLLDHGVAFQPSPQPAQNTTSPSPRSATGGAIDTQAVREWARANGYQLPDRGRIPAPIVAAYKKANPQ